MELGMQGWRRSNLLTTATLIPLLMTCGCSDRDDARVVPESGVNQDPISYEPTENPLETSVDVPKVSVGSQVTSPVSLPTVTRQRTGFPIAFHGVVDDVPGGIVMVRFYSKGTRKDGSGTVTNEFQTILTAREDGGGFAYDLRGKTPASADTHEVEIIVSYPTASAGETPKLTKRVIATGELSTESHD